MGASILAFGRTMLVLALVIGLLLVLARFGRRRLQRAQAGARPGGRIEVLSRRSLGKHVSLLVVRVASRTFLVGQSAQQMTMLAELDGDEWVEALRRPQPGITTITFSTPRTVSGTGEDLQRHGMPS